MSIVSWIVLLLLIAIAIVAFVAWFYQRASTETSLVKTGIGGRKVVLNGGTLALPYFHEITRVNMQTLRLDVERRGEQALITKDRLRLDVVAEFYTSVMPDEDAVARAAQTLGQRTFQRSELGSLIDGLMVDALRAVAARMTMDEVHEQRSVFSSEVRDSLTDALSRYGLQLDAVSLTALDQTPFSALDENNAFNAVGMRKLAEVIATSRKERAQIDADADVSVRRAAMEASRLSLEIDLDERRAQISQQQEIETLSSVQIAEIAIQRANSELQAAKARIDMEQKIESAEIQRDQALHMAERDRDIALHVKSLEQRNAEISADNARAEAVKASEAVNTIKAVAEVERRNSVALLSAESEAKAKARREQIAAESERDTAKDIADARREAADADKSVKLAEAESYKARIEAENSRSESLIAMEIEKARLESLPHIVREMVKPAEKIKSININHLSGSRSDSPGNGQGDKSAVNQAFDSIMDMAVQLPVLKKIGESVGVNFEDGLSGIADQGKSNGDKNV